MDLNDWLPFGVTREIRTESSGRLALSEYLFLIVPSILRTWCVCVVIRTLLVLRDCIHAVSMRGHVESGKCFIHSGTDVKSEQLHCTALSQNCPSGVGA